MKKTLLTLTLALSSILVFGQYTYTENWPNGKKKIEGNYNSAVEIGQNESKEEQAKKMAQAIRVGKWQHWFENGQLASLEYYTDGVMTGQWKSWYADGSVQYDIDFATGKAVIYHANGKKASEGKMLTGMIHDGNWISYYETGIKNVEGAYNNGQKNGDWKFYDEKGNHYFTEKWNNGVKAN